MGAAARSATDRDAAPIRALVVSRPSNVWGAQLRLLLTAPELLRRGVELTLAVPEGNPFAERWRDAGLPLVPIAHRADDVDSIRRPDGRRVGPVAICRVAVHTATSAIRLARLVRRFDVVLSFSRHAHVEVVAAARLARRPVIVEIVDIVRPGLGRFVLRQVSRLARVVVVNSRATGATVGSAPRRVYVVHPGVDVERFAPGPADAAMRQRLGGRADAALVGIVGRLDPSKGIELVADALALAESSGGHPNLATATLAIIGDRGIAPAEYVETLRARIQERLGSRATFAGRVEEVAVALRAMDVLVNASDAEPFGRSVLEAQATGTPVVAVRGGGIPEFVEDAVTGLLVPPGDVERLANALERVLADADLALRLGRAGREQAVNRFAPATRYDELARIYRNLVEKRRG